MKPLEIIAARQQESAPTYFDDPEKDRMLKLILELCEEICVLRDRLDTATHLAESDQPATPSRIDEHVIDEAETERRLAAHQSFYEEVLKQLV